jgi:hypothetical protein
MRTIEYESGKLAGKIILWGQHLGVLESAQRRKFMTIERDAEKDNRYMSLEMSEKLQRFDTH